MVETTHLSDAAREDGWNPLRRHFDIKAFGVNAWTAKEADAELIGEHDEARSGHEELYVLVSGKAGEAYVPRAWETNALIFPLFGRGEFEEARRQLTEALDRYEDREALLYNLACAEARLGETEAALGHLAEALQRSERLLELARTDEDLDSLRGESRFDELIGATTG